MDTSTVPPFGIFIAKVKTPAELFNDSSPGSGSRYISLFTPPSISICLQLILVPWILYLL
jgi:hypothetical protein